ncbi:MAG: isochorismatase family protein [Syntrophobacteraceae bacterium]|nr:isochorismatase family protein [Syntrophobacteraceae bacterium]
MAARREDSLLLVIDIQQAMLKVIDSWENVTGKVNQLTRAADILGIPVVLTEQYPRGLGRTIPQVLQAVQSPRVYEKEHFSACQEPGFLDMLRSLQRPRVVLVGVEAHVCVLQTGLDLLQAGLQVQVAADAVASRAPFNRDTGIELLRQAGAVITTTEIVMFQWIHRSNTDAFRKVHPILK